MDFFMNQVIKAADLGNACGNEFASLFLENRIKSRGMVWLLFASLGKIVFCILVLHVIRRYVSGCLRCELVSLIHLMGLAAFG